MSPDLEVIVTAGSLDRERARQIADSGWPSARGCRVGLAELEIVVGRSFRNANRIEVRGRAFKLC